MKKLSIVFVFILVVLASCTKSKEVHPETGDGNDEILMVGMRNIHVIYMPANIEDLHKVVFYYSLSEAKQFNASEMINRENCFELTLDSLLSDTLYYYYYEIFPNGSSSYHSEHRSFYTQAFVEPELPEPPTPPNDVPEGAVNGLFTINENGEQIYFSRGNLQYDISAQTWSFMEHQYDMVEAYDWYDVGVNYSNQSIVRHFGWGTSGFDCGNSFYHPYETGDDSNGDYEFGPLETNDLTGEFANSDWGVYNAIINGGNTVNQWRTLTIEEWQYLCYNRITLSSIRYAKAIVNDVCGLIILPDNWDTSIFGLNDTNTSFSSYNSNIISASDWIMLENLGVVFLPNAGERHGHFVRFVGDFGCYWSASCYSNERACVWGIQNGYISYGSIGRSSGCSVRLVYDVR